MAKWLENALGYADQWLGFQMRLTRQPGCVIAVAHKERLVFEHRDTIQGNCTSM